MIHPVLIYGNKILEQSGETISQDYPSLKTFIDDMFETMYAANGIGLAAHQIGVPIRLFVIDISHYSERDEKNKDFKKVFINSEIIEEDGQEQSFEEGCLSFPGLHIGIKRSERIKLKYFDENFQLHEEWFDSLASRCIQHEHDHTNGILFLRKTNPLRRKLSEGKLKNIVKGKFSTSYKYKM